MAAMTDVVANFPASVPSRLGASARLGDDGELVIELRPTEFTSRLGIVRTSMLVYVADVVAGIPADTRDDAWTLTTELSVRAAPVPAPVVVEGRHRTLREGHRSATAEVSLVDGDGRSVGVGVASFSRVTRRPDDPPKFRFEIPGSFEAFGAAPPLDEPLRDAVGLRIVDGRAGVVEVEVTPLLQNPAGTLQGAIVAFVAEVAAEELLSAHLRRPAVVTELDVRYLGQARPGVVVRSRARLAGDWDGAPVVVELVDAATGRLVTHVTARGVSAG
jgi:acyl-coenzyme A thioesterase PaaI-like protein